MSSSRPSLSFPGPRQQLQSPGAGYVVPPYDPSRPQHARRTGDIEQQSTSTVDLLDGPPAPSSSAAAAVTAVGRRSPSRASSMSASQRSVASDAFSRSEHLGPRFTGGSTAPSTVAQTTVSPGHTAKDHDQDDGRSYLPDDEMHDIMNHPDVVLAIDSTRFHAGDRKPIDPYWRPRWEMANFHVALWNALEQVYIHAPHIAAEDTEAFARYGSAVVHAIDTHHDCEDEYYFPALEVAISMQANLEQHASFDDGLRALKFYLRSCVSDPTIFSASTVLSIIDTFAIDLATHFSDELNTINPEVLREFFSIADLEKQGASLQKHVVKDYKRHLYTALPVVIVNTPPGREWPSLSPMYRRILLPIFLGRKYRTSWKYGKWPSALNVFGGRTAAPAASSLAMSPSIRGAGLSIPPSSRAGGSSFINRATSFTSAPGTVKTDVTPRGPVGGLDGLPLTTTGADSPLESEADKLARNLQESVGRKASVRSDSTGTASVASSPRGRAQLPTPAE